MPECTEDYFTRFVGIHRIRLQAAQSREELLAFARETGMLTKKNFPRFIEALEVIDINYEILPGRSGHG